MAQINAALNAPEIDQTGYPSLAPLGVIPEGMCLFGCNSGIGHIHNELSLSVLTTYAVRMGKWSAMPTGEFVEMLRRMWRISDVDITYSVKELMAEGYIDMGRYSEQVYVIPLLRISRFLENVEFELRPLDEVTAWCGQVLPEIKRGPTEVVSNLIWITILRPFWFLVDLSESIAHARRS